MKCPKDEIMRSAYARTVSGKHVKVSSNFILYILSIID